MPCVSSETKPAPSPDHDVRAQTAPRTPLGNSVKSCTEAVQTLAAICRRLQSEEPNLFETMQLKELECPVVFVGLSGTTKSSTMNALLQHFLFNRKPYRPTDTPELIHEMETIQPLDRVPQEVREQFQQLRHDIRQRKPSNSRAGISGEPFPEGQVIFYSCTDTTVALAALRRYP